MKPKLKFLAAATALLLAVGLQPARAQSSLDFGDAPSPYPTILNQNGARHTATGPLLGALRDTENDGQPNAFAQGDDNIGDDEDGVIFVSAMVPGQMASIQVTVNGAPNGARLDAWLDFDANGSWAETVDRIFASQQVFNGVTTLTFPVPAGAKVGATFARFRISFSGDLNFVGAAANGEVEDYRVGITEAMDFGDAPVSAAGAGGFNYPTLLSQNGARHRVIPNFLLGARIDVEPDGQPNATATGDDINPTAADDEDGISFTSAITAGSNASVQVVVALPAGFSSARLNAWLDFNRDGDWGETNEQIFTDVAVVAGTANLSFPVPATASGGQTYARFRLNTNGKIGPNGSTSEGEVEDYQVNVTAALDFGDAPSPYPTLLKDNGARHNYTNRFCLGINVDGEADGQPDVDAKGDDSNPAGAADDEDGVNFTTSIVPAQTAGVEVLVTLPPGVNGAILNAWLDFNRDGDWADPGEQIFFAQPVIAGVNTLNFPVPQGASQGLTYARFRLSNARSLSFTGPADDGEVEDYLVNLSSANMDYGDAPKPYPTFLAENGARHTFNPDIFLGFRVDTEPDGQPDLNALGDDLNGPDEDGVIFTSPLIPGSSANVQVRASTTGILHAWVDFNGNGSWADPGEKIFNALGISGGTNNLSFNVPATARTGLTFSRFRFTQQTAVLDFVGPGPGGEVEDHRVSIIPDRDRCDHNCEGKEYWLTFPGNYAPDPDNPARLSLCVKGANGTAVNVSVPGIGFTTNVIIPVAQATFVHLPRAAELGDLVDVVTNIGIRVLSSAPVSITAYNHARYTTDSYMALNTSVVGNRYIVMGYGNTQSGVPPLNGTQFALVATESNTVVAILPRASGGSRTAGVPYLLQLAQPGDAYQLRSTNDAPADLSGSLILADKPIAVFGGHQCANVPTKDVWFCDYLVEQLLPLNTWGNDFYTAPLATRTGGDTFRILAGQNNTQIAINGVLQPALNLGQFQQITLAVASRIIADKPIFVTQFANSGDFDGRTNADPFMLTVPATRHYASNYRICTPTNDFPTNYVYLTVPTAAVGSIQIDGLPVGAGAFSVIAATAYSAAQVLITPGRHFVIGSALFGLSVYGWAEYDSYGHPACMYFGDVVPPRITPSSTGATASVDDYPNTPGFVPSPNFASGTAVQDNCDPDPRTPDQEPKPGTLVPPGVHTVTLSLADVNGNIGETNVTFTVIDPSPVTIVCPANLVVNCQTNNGAIVHFEVSAYSLYDTNVPVVSTPPSGSFFPSGTTQVTSVATSLAGQSNTCSFTVTVLCNRRVTAVSGRSGLTLSWDGLGTVQFATNPVGPWSNVVSGVSQYVAPLTGKQGYFRVLY